MKDGVRAGEQAEVSRRELYEDYVNCYRQLAAEVRPCRDARLLEKAAQYLLKDPDPSGTFTVFPFHRAVSGSRGAPSADCRELLSAFIRAAEMLETLCVNLFLQPWKKEIKTLKTFTGQFVYCLLPVLSGSAIQSVLASIGYLPHTNSSPQSEYRLSEDANPDRAMLVGFELLLARVECYHLLELLDRDQLGPQECLDVLQRRVGPTKLEENKATIVQREEEEEEKKKKEEPDRKEVPLYLDNRLAVNTQLKPRRLHLTPPSVDQSIMEMQMTYPDLAFRGRPLLPDKPQRASSSRSRGNAARAASANVCNDDSKAAELPKRECTKGSTAAPADSSGGGDLVFGDGNDGGAAGPPGALGFGNTEEGGADQELGPPLNVSLHITLRAGAAAEQGPKPEEPQPTTEPPARTRTAADRKKKKLAIPGPPSPGSMDEEQDLRELVEWAGQLHLRGDEEEEEEVTRMEETGRGEECTQKKRRKRGAGGTEEKSLRRPTTGTGSVAPSHTASSLPGPTETSGREQPTECHPHPPPPTASTADRRLGPGQWGGGEDTDRAEEEGEEQEQQLAQSYVIVE